MSAQIQKVTKQIKKMNTISDRANTGFKRMEKSAKATAATISRDFKKAYEEAKPDNFFKGVKTAGTTLTAMGVAGAGVLASATNSAISFESAFAGVRKTVDASEEEFAQFKQQIRSMAKVIPATHEEIASVAEAAGQLGIQKEAIMGFTRTMIDLGVATNMTSDEAATALARFANITQMSAKDYDRLGSTIVGLGNNLATTESEIVEMGLRLAGAGAQIGMSEAQILALSGALSSVGIAAEAGGSAFSKLMIDMASEVATNGKNLANFAKVSGMTSQQFKTAFKDDAGGALITFIEGLGRMSKEGENVFGVLDEMGLSEIRLRDALLRASGAGDLFRESMELGTAAWMENTALTDEARERYKTTESQLKVLKNIIRDVGITLGDVFLPHVITASKTIGNLAERVNNLSPKTKKMIAIMLMATTAFALIGGPLLLLIALLPSIAAGFAFIGITSVAALGPVAIAIAGVVAAGIILYHHWDTIKTKAGELWAKLTETFNSIKEGITSAMGGAKDGFLGALQSMKSGAASIVNSIINVFNGMISGLNSMRINVPDWVPGIGGKELSLSIPKIPNVKSHYHGIDYVPYDGYTARLHKGERVQTAQEAKESRQGGGSNTGAGGVLITGNTFHVRQESDIEAIANALAIKVFQAKEAGA